MRRAAAAVIVASGSAMACTALLDLQGVRFDDVDGASLEAGDAPTLGDGGGDEVPPARCALTPGESDGGVPPGTTLCPGVGSVDLTTNSAHCGACDHDCGGANCALGICEPETISDELSRTGFLGTDGDYIVWTSSVDAGLCRYRTALADGGDVRELGTLPFPYNELGAVGPGFLYVARPNDTGVVFPLDGGAAFSPMGQANSGTVAIGGSEIFVDNENRTSILKTTATPSGPTKGLLTGQEGIQRLAVSGSFVYFVQGPDDGGIAPVKRVHRDQATVDDSVWQVRASAIASDGVYVYVWDNRANTLVRLPLDLSGTPETLATWTGTPWAYATGIVVDPLYVYVEVFYNNSNAVLRVPRCGGAPVRLASYVSVASVGVVGDHVYWGDSAEGKVRRVHR